jgi:hypothetical protein
MFFQHKMRLQGAACACCAVRGAARRHGDISVPGLQPPLVSHVKQCDMAVISPCRRAGAQVLLPK